MHTVARSSTLYRKQGAAEERSLVLALQRMSDAPSDAWSILMGEPTEASCSGKSNPCCCSLRSRECCGG